MAYCCNCKSLWVLETILEKRTYESFWKKKCNSMGNFLDSKRVDCFWGVEIDDGDDDLSNLFKKQEENNESNFLKLLC